VDPSQWHLRCVGHRASRRQRQAAGSMWSQSRRGTSASTRRSPVAGEVVVVRRRNKQDHSVTLRVSSLHVCHVPFDPFTCQSVTAVHPFLSLFHRHHHHCPAIHHRAEVVIAHSPSDFLKLDGTSASTRSLAHPCHR
jgi:hypothetical protein